jgi:predicted Rossmann fold nucleotide-binding protein DprA/Smf involved in DNA uptake
MNGTTCHGCVARDQHLADLKQVLTHLQHELRKSMGKRTLAVLDALDGQPALSAAEIAKRAKMPLGSVTGPLIKLRKRGLVRRAGWRDVPGSRWPVAEFSMVAARETLNGAGVKR